MGVHLPRFKAEKLLEFDNFLAFLIAKRQGGALVFVLTCYWLPIITLYYKQLYTNYAVFIIPVRLACSKIPPSSITGPACKQKQKDVEFSGKNSLKNLNKT